MTAIREIILGPRQSSYINGIDDSSTLLEFTKNSIYKKESGTEILENQELIIENQLQFGIIKDKNFIKNEKFLFNSSSEKIFNKVEEDNEITVIYNAGDKEITLFVKYNITENKEIF